MATSYDIASLLDQAEGFEGWGAIVRATITGTTTGMTMDQGGIYMNGVQIFKHNDPDLYEFSQILLDSPPDQSTDVVLGGNMYAGLNEPAKTPDAYTWYSSDPVPPLYNDVDANPLLSDGDAFIYLDGGLPGDGSIFFDVFDAGWDLTSGVDRTINIEMEVLEQSGSLSEFEVVYFNTSLSRFALQSVPYAVGSYSHSIVIPSGAETFGIGLMANSGVPDTPIKIKITSVSIS